MADTKLSALALGTVSDYIYGIQSGASKKFHGLSWFNVMDYGATGAGSPTDDHAAIKEAFDNCAGSGGGTVFFPDPAVSYYISKSVIWDYGNIDIVIRGNSTRAAITGSFPDFLLKRLQVDAGGVADYNRVVENLSLINTNYTPSTPAAITSITWAAVGEVGTATVTTTAPHGVAVGEYKLTNIAGASGYNGQYPCKSTGSSTLTFDNIGDGGTVATGTYSFVGGALAFTGSLRGMVQNLVIQGYIGVFAAPGAGYASITCLNLSMSCGSDKVSGSVGISLGGQANIFACDITHYGTAIRITGNGGVVTGCRIELNNIAIHMDASAWKIFGNTFEGNVWAWYLHSGSANCFEANTIHGEIASNGSDRAIYIPNPGGVTYSTFKDLLIYGDYKESVIDIPANLTGTSFENVSVTYNSITTTQSTANGNDTLHFDTYIPSWLVAGLGLYAGAYQGFVQSGTSVIAVGANTVTLSLPLSGGSIPSGAPMYFFRPTGGAAGTWKIDPGAGVQFKSCNNPPPVATQTYANRPTTPLEGDEWTFLDIHTTDFVWGGVVGATGTGANKGVARYSSYGDKWVVVAKAP